MDALYVLVLFSVIGGFLWVVRKDNEIFRVSIRAGRATVVRGRVPPSFLCDLRGVVRGVEGGTIRAVKQGGHPHLVTSPSIDEATAQRLRNAFSLYPASKKL